MLIVIGFILYLETKKSLHEINIPIPEGAQKSLFTQLPRLSFHFKNNIEFFRSGETNNWYLHSYPISQNTKHKPSLYSGIYVLNDSDCSKYALSIN